MLKYILDGGFIMLPLLLLSVLALGVIIDRLRAFRAADVDSTSLREKIIDCLQGGKVEDAAKTCETFKGPVAAILLVGIRKYERLVARKRSLTEIEANVNKTMTDYAPHIIEALEKRLNLLMLIASVSPLLGMTGTVTGMIRSFNSMSASGVSGGAVAGGISEALITTAAGLLIAIPSVIFHNLFSKKVDRYVLDIEESATELIDFITLEEGRAPAAKPKRASKPREEPAAE